MNHGVYVSEREAGASAPLAAQSGVPFVIGFSPVHTAAHPAAPGEPVLCASFEEAVDRLGYSENYMRYTLCEFMYSHFKLYGRQPVIFYNLLDLAVMTTPMLPMNYTITENRALLPFATLILGLRISEADGAGVTYARGTDYDVYYTDGYLAVELLPGGAAYGASTVYVESDIISTGLFTPELVAAGLENIEKCLTTVGVVPDLICAPRYSKDPAVAAAMAAKAAGINGIFKAKALIDLNSNEMESGAVTPAEAIALKAENKLTDENQIVCWPMLRLGNRVFHMSTQLAGLIAEVDGGNGGCPYESPSNKAFRADALALDYGADPILTHAQANALNAQGIVTPLNFMGGLVCWGNYTACYPENTALKDSVISISRMFDWVGATLVRTFWSRLDKPISARLRDNIVDTCNIWLNGLTGAGYLLGARVEVLDAENPAADLMAGIIRAHIYLTPASPAQEIDLILEYDAAYAAAALAG
jgi:phage tail sheath protein FI